MRVRVERSGGFAGVVVRGEADTAQLELTDPGAAQELRELVTQADVVALARGAVGATAGGGRPRGADRFTYRVEVLTDGGGDDGDGGEGAAAAAPRSVDVQLGEGEVPQALRPLIDHVLARRGPPAG